LIVLFFLFVLWGGGGYKWTYKQTLRLTYDNWKSWVSLRWNEVTDKYTFSEDRLKKLVTVWWFGIFDNLASVQSYGFWVRGVLLNMHKAFDLKNFMGFILISGRGVCGCLIVIFTLFTSYIFLWHFPVSCPQSCRGRDHIPKYNTRGWLYVYFSFSDCSWDKTFDCWPSLARFNWFLFSFWI